MVSKNPSEDRSSISTDAVAQYEAFSDHTFVTHLCACLRLTVVTTRQHVHFSIPLLKLIQTKANKSIFWNSSIFMFNAVHLRCKCSIKIVSSVTILTFPSKFKLFKENLRG